jgi:hypothetical protein
MWQLRKPPLTLLPFCFIAKPSLGKTNDSHISGVLVCRGDDILPVVQVGPDWESFT